jgi:hypothetical protein
MGFFIDGSIDNPNTWGWYIYYYPLQISVVYTLRSLSTGEITTYNVDYSYGTNPNSLNRGYPILFTNSGFTKYFYYKTSNSTTLPYKTNPSALDGVYIIKDTLSYTAQDGWEIIGFRISKLHQVRDNHGASISLGSKPKDTYLKPEDAFGICIETVKAVESITEPPNYSVDNVVKWTAIEKA